MNERETWADRAPVVGGGQAGGVALGAVEVVPAGGGLAPEAGRAGEGFAAEALVPDGAVDGLHVALPGAAPGRDAAVVRAQGPDGGGQALGGLVFEEPTAVVGLPDQAGEVDGELLG